MCYHRLLYLPFKPCRSKFTKTVSYRLPCTKSRISGSEFKVDSCISDWWKYLKLVIYVNYLLPVNLLRSSRQIELGTGYTPTTTITTFQNGISVLGLPIRTPK